MSTSHPNISIEIIFDPDPPPHTHTQPLNYTSQQYPSLKTRCRKYYLHYSCCIGQLRHRYVLAPSVYLSVTFMKKALLSAFTIELDMDSHDEQCIHVHFKGHSLFTYMFYIIFSMLFHALYVYIVRGRGRLFMSLMTSRGRPLLRVGW